MLGIVIPITSDNWYVVMLILFVLTLGSFFIDWTLPKWVMQNRILRHLRSQNFQLLSLREDIPPHGFIEARGIRYWLVTYRDGNGILRKRLYTCGLLRTFIWTEQE